GGTAGAAVGGGVGGAAGAAVGRELGGGSGAAPRSGSGNTASGPIRVQGTAPGVAVSQTHTAVDDPHCKGKHKHKQHPGKGWAKGHNKSRC
ncbi:MAG: hypothetical protein ACREUO_01715, partial [Burkholderiales bacterium]